MDTIRPRAPGFAPPDAYEDWADLVQLRHHVQPGARRRRGLRPDGRRLLLILLLVVLPTALAGVYFERVAASRYVAEARFIVRKPASISAGALTAASPEQTLQSGDEDAYAVRDYLLSRDAMRAMEQQAGLRDAIARAGADPLWRFPGPLGSGSEEALFHYYLRLVDVTHEVSTGVTTLTVQAFDPEDARRLAAALEDAGEALLNRLQARARQDAVRIADSEVARTRALADAAQGALTAFRMHESVIDPTLVAQTVQSTITALSLQVVEAGAELDLLVHASPGSPQIPPLRSRLAALQAQIDRERGSLAGADSSLAPRIAEYERLSLLRDFAVRNYIAALTALESARLDALRQRVYLERVVQPQAADRASYPHRLISVLVVFGIGVVAYRMVRPTARGSHR